MNSKYIIDTEENKSFMKGLTEDLLKFGHKFPAPTGSSYYLGVLHGLSCRSASAREESSQARRIQGDRR